MSTAWVMPPGSPGDPSGRFPVLAGRRVTLRPGGPDDARRLHEIQAEPSVARWWVTPDPVAAIERAIRAYASVGFRPVGVMRQYERGPDGRFHDGLLMDLLRGELAGP